MGDSTARDEEHSGATTVRQQTQSGRLLSVIALVVAVAAVALAGWAVVTGGGAEPEAADPAAQDPAAAKARVCTAFETVTRAVQLQTNSDLGPDPVAQTAVAGNARLALLGGGLYLTGQVSEDTPQDLADAVGRFATTLQDIGMNALTGVTNQDSVQLGRLNEGERLRQEVAGLCA
jgi:hypothetical protein